MSLIKGRVDRRRGAVIDVLVGVPGNRERLLVKHALPVPATVAVRAQIDSGSFVTGFGRAVFEQLGLNPVGTMKVYTPSTEDDRPAECDVFTVSLCLVANANVIQLPDANVIAAGGWHSADEAKAIVGRDVLEHCNFFYYGPERAFSIAVVPPGHQ